MTLIQRALSNSGCIRNSIKNRIKDSLSDNRFRTLTIKQKMQDSIRQGKQESFYETANAGVSLSDSGCRSLSIRQRMQEIPYQKGAAGVFFLYQTSDAGLSLTENAGATPSETP